MKTLSQIVQVEGDSGIESEVHNTIVDLEGKGFKIISIHSVTPTPEGNRLAVGVDFLSRNFLKKKRSNMQILSKNVYIEGKDTINNAVEELKAQGFEIKDIRMTESEQGQIPARNMKITYFKPDEVS